MSSTKKIAIELTNQEALVLFEYLHRCDDERNYTFVDQSEERVLWKVEGMLEKQLVEVFSPDYWQLVNGARTRIRESD